MGKESKGEIEALLSPLLEEDDRRKAFRRRRDVFDYKKVSKEDEKKFTKDRSEVYKTLQTYSWLKKPKFPDTLLEDRIWCLLYRMGYPVLSGEKFHIQTRAHDGIRKGWTTWGNQANDDYQPTWKTYSYHSASRLNVAE